MNNAADETTLQKSNSPAKKPLRSCLILLLVLAAALGLIISGLAVIGWMEIDASPLEVSGISAFLRPDSYRYSPEQRDLIDQLGSPDSFLILFYEDEFGGTSTRLETWIYSQQGRSYTWVNGEVDGQDRFEPVTGEILHAPYTPDQFTAYMSLEELIGSTGIEEFLLVPLEMELLPGGESYFADRLTFGLMDGALLYVEAVGFAAGEESPAASDPVEDTPSTEDTPAAEQADSEALQESSPTWPNVPLVFASDASAPNYDQCHPENSCFLQVFYTPSPLEESGQDLTGPLGFVAAHEPALSPDGARVAFTGYVEGEGENHIYIVNTDGSGLRVMTLKGFNHGHPSWSPDGTQLVIMSSPAGQDSYHLYLIDVESRQAVQLTSGNNLDRFPDWSPDGRWIVFHSNRADPNPESCWPNCQMGLHLIEIESGQIYPFEAENGLVKGSGAAWSPDGTRLAYHSKQAGSWDIYIADLDGSVRRLTDSPGEELFPAWSPDGNYIAYSGDTTTGKDIAVTPVLVFDEVYYTGKAAFDAQPDW